MFLSSKEMQMVKDASIGNVASILANGLYEYLYEHISHSRISFSTLFYTGGCDPRQVPKIIIDINKDDTIDIEFEPDHIRYYIDEFKFRNKDTLQHSRILPLHILEYNNPDTINILIRFITNHTEYIIPPYA